MNRNIKIILLLILAAALMGGGVFAGMNWNRWFGASEQKTETEPVTAQVDDRAEDWTGEKDVYQGEKNTDTIDIPGFDAMTMKAGETKQSVNLYNPPQNSCYFKMSIRLSDGAVIWQSSLVEPGKAIYELTLEEALEAGSYEDAVLKYECFAMNEEQTPLNGSEIKFTLHVLK